MNPFSLINIISSLIFIALGLYGYNAGRREPGSKIYRPLLLVCLCISLWGFSFAFMHSARSREEIEFWYDLSAPGWCLYSALFVHAVLLITGKEAALRRRWVYILIYAPGMIFALREITGSLYAMDFVRVGHGISEVPDTGNAWFWLFIVHQTLCELLGLILLFLWGRRSRIKREKKQASAMIISSSASLVLAFTSDILLPALDVFIVPAMSPIFILIWGSGIWYSIARYKFISLKQAFTSDEIASRMQDLFFILDLEGSITKINPQVVDLLGFDEPFILRSSFQVLLESGDAFLAAFGEMIENDSSRFETEGVLLTREGDKIPARINGSMLRDKFGDPIGVVIIAMDLREKLRLQMEMKERALGEEALRSSEEKYRTIVENIKESYYELDRAGNFTFVNQSMCRIFGRTMDELIGLNYRDYMPEDAARHVFTVFNRVFTLAVRAELVEIPIYRKDGTLRYIELSVDLRTDSSGAGIGFRGMVRDTTERKEAENALRRSEEKYRTLLQTNNIGYFESDLEGNVSYCNDVMESFTGYTREELIGLNFKKIMSAEMAGKVFKRYHQVFLKEISFASVDHEILRKDGTVGYFETTISLVTDRAGVPVGFRVIGIDITNKKLIEQALRESEERYRLVIENINDAIFICKFDGHLKYMSPSMARLAGYSAEEMLDTHYLHYIHRDYRKRELDLYIQQVRDSIEVAEHEYPLVAKDGRLIWVGQTVRMVTNQMGEVEFFGVIRDISDRKAAEDALRRSELLYQQLMENVSDCVFICSKEGIFKYVNPAVTRLIGLSQEDLIGTHYKYIIHPEHRTRQVEFYGRQVRDGIEVTYCEFPALKKNGGVIWAGQTVRMVRNSEGDIEFYGVTHDITALKEAEKARRELDEAKARFFSNISHEIRTPLTLMLGPVESVLMGSYSGSIDDAFFENLHRNCLRLLTLVNDLLDFSKIDAGKMTMKVAEGDMVPFARSYIDSLEITARTRNIRLQFSASAGPIILCFDPERLDKVFMNLLSNALKFTGSGGTIGISVAGDDDACLITVADTGEGIPAGSMGAIFERFGQADAASTRRHQGTGIGLALAKELVAMHAGTISVESRHAAEYPDSHGTVFTISLPKGKKHFENRRNVEFVGGFDFDAYIHGTRTIGSHEMEGMKNGNTTVPCGELTGELPEDPGAKTVLVVDDSGDMRNFLKILLHQKYRVILAENGEEGLRCARRHRPNLIIADVMMPVMSGFEMTSIIKNDDELKTTPVIMLTADTELATKVIGLEFGADDYLHKPFNSLELMTRVSSLLKNYEYQQIIRQRNRDIESELDVARMLQQRLLPESLPHIPGYRTHAVYIPMDKVGGDFYDVGRRDDYIDIFIADVTGHGLPGAFLAAVTKISFDNIIDRTGPGDVVSRLNGVINRYTVSSNFVTAFYAIVDVKTRVMRYSNAGHVPPLVYRKRLDEFTELKTRGTPLGCFADSAVEEQRISLEPGDRVVFYTDGISECMDPSKAFFGEVHFRALIRDHVDKTAAEFTGELLKALEAFKGENIFDDDITMVVLDVR